MIKVGQIWQNTEDKSDTIVVTNIYKSSSNCQRDWDIDYIWADGTTVSSDSDYWVKYKRKLIAKYPTWLEAVNSKEFNNAD